MTFSKMVFFPLVKMEINYKFNKISIARNGNILTLIYNDKPDKPITYDSKLTNPPRSWTHTHYYDYLLREAYHLKLCRERGYEFHFDENKIGLAEKCLLVSIIFFYHGLNEGFEYFAYFESLKKIPTGSYRSRKGKEIVYERAYNMLQNHVFSVIFQNDYTKPVRRKNFTAERYVEKKLCPLVIKFCKEKHDTEINNGKNKKRTIWSKFIDDCATTEFNNMLSSWVHAYLNSIPVKNKRNNTNGS